MAISLLGRNTPGRSFYDRKVAEGNTSKEAIWALKRRLSDVVYRRPVTDARPQHGRVNGPGRTKQERLISRLFGHVTPGPNNQRYDPPRRLARGSSPFAAHNALKIAPWLKEASIQSRHRCLPGRCYA
jgi:hypothetical protein